MTIAKCAAILLGLLATSVRGDRATGFNFKSASCSTNSVTNFQSSCDGDSPCRMGEHAEVSGTYTVGTAVPKQVEICASVQVMSISVYSAGCQDVNVCDYLDGCSNDYDDIEPGSYSFDFNSKIPGESNWIGSGYSFKFVFEATASESGSQVESCQVVVQASSISSTSAIMALASLCTAAAAIYYRRRRRTAAIDLESEENAIQADFVEMSKAGVSV